MNPIGPCVDDVLDLAIQVAEISSENGRCDNWMSQNERLPDEVRDTRTSVGTSTQSSSEETVAISVIRIEPDQTVICQDVGCGASGWGHTFKLMMLGEERLDDRLTFVWNVAAHAVDQNPTLGDMV